MTNTGNEGMLFALMDACGDSDPSVREAVTGSLTTLGKHSPPMLLNAVIAYLARQAKLPSPHRSLVLSVVNTVCSENIDRLDEGQLPSLLINLATQEMTMSKDSDPEWQASASSVLVTLGRKYCTTVMEALLQKYQPGYAPHPYILQTLSDLAASNAHGFVPFLSDVLSRTLPMLSSSSLVKSDTIKKAFALSLKNYSEALREYLSDHSADNDPNITTNHYAPQFAAAYDVIFPAWVTVKDYKVRAAVIQCVGKLCQVLSLEKLTEELRKLLPVVLGMYKKPNIDLLAISQGLCNLLEATVQHEGCPIENYLEDVWVTLFPQITDDIDYNVSDAGKTRNEVLRCFHVTACVNADRLVYYLVQKIQSSASDRNKLSSICILRHLVNSSGPFLSNKHALVMRGLRPTLQDVVASVKVKRALCHLTIALADHNYLENEDGTFVIEFLVRNTTTLEENGQKKPAGDHMDQNMAALSSLRAQCGQALVTIAKNNKNAHSLLWPYLYEYLCVEQYTSALGDICKCLFLVAEAKLEDKEEIVVEHLGELVNEHMPGRHQVLARLICLFGGSPLVSQSRTMLTYFNLLDKCAHWLHPSFPPVFEKHGASLRKHLTNGSTGLSQRDWEAAVLKFVLELVNQVSDGQWRQAFAAALAKQFHLYNAMHDEKRFLCRCLGGVLTKVLDNQFVMDYVELMFKSINPQNHLERLGCAQAVGFCATVHADLVLTRLENIAKWEHQKGHRGFFGFIKDNMPSMKSADGTELDACSLRACILLCFGYVVWYCPIDLITQRLNNPIMRFLKPFFESPKETVVKEALCQTIVLIGNTLHPSHLKADYTLDDRTQFLNYVVQYVQSESTDSCTTCVRVLGAQAVAALAKLEPPFSSADTKSVLGVMCAHYYALNTVNVPAMYEIQLSKENILTPIHEVFGQVLRKKPTVNTLTALKNVVQPYMASEHASERVRSLQTLLQLLKNYYQLATDCSLGTATDFSLLGTGFGRFCPRFVDSDGTVRVLALDCVHWLLQLGALHKGLGKDYHDTCLDQLDGWRTALQTDDADAHMSVMHQLAQVIEQRLPQKQLQTYLSVLFDILLDKQESVSKSAAVLLRHMLTARGELLSAECETLVSTLLAKMSNMPSKQTYDETLQALLFYSQHHLIAVLGALLNQSLPFSNAVVSVWHTLARNTTLVSTIITFLCDSIDECDASPYEQPDGTNIRLARPHALTLTAAVIELCKGAESVEQLSEAVPRLLSVLLVHCASLVGTQFPYHKFIEPELRKIHSYPASLVHSAIKTLLVKVRTDAIVQHLNAEHAWADFEDTQHYSNAMYQLGKALAANYPQWVQPLSDLFEPKLAMFRDEQRIATMSMLASFMKTHPNSKGKPDHDLLASLVDMHVRALADTCITVRLLAVRGLGELAHSEQNQLKRYTSIALTAVMSGLEDAGDSKDQVSLEAMQALNKLAAKLDREHMDEILVSVLLRIRPCFEKDSGAVRSVAFELFAQLAMFGDCDAYREQLHTNMCALLLHLFDSEPHVQMACVHVLASAGRLMSDNVAQKIETHLLKPLNFHDFNSDRISVDMSTPQANELTADIYRTFLREFSAVLATEFNERLNFFALCASNYFKSSSSRIRANAALFTGYLLGAARPEIRRTVSKELIWSGIALLLKESETEVRLCAAESMASLCDYF